MCRNPRDSWTISNPTLQIFSSVVPNVLRSRSTYLLNLRNFTLLQYSFCQFVRCLYAEMSFFFFFSFLNVLFFLSCMATVEVIIWIFFFFWFWGRKNNFNCVVSENFSQICRNYQIYLSYYCCHRCAFKCHFCLGRGKFNRLTILCLLCVWEFLFFLRV